MANLNEFYENTNILITGGTGFIGKVLIEKLLRSQNNIKTIYILIRDKKGKTCDYRIKSDIFSQPIFNYLKENNVNFMDKVKAVEGDITQPRLGLKENDFELILNEINIVFHVAASLNMAASLKYNARYNICSVIELLNICRQMQNLKGIAIVSTAYSNCNHNVIEEKIVKSIVSPSLALKMCEEIDDNILKNITQGMLNGLPNTYTLSKCIMENVLLEYEDLPIVLFRPSIVVSAYKEPLPGWIDNLNGPLSFILITGLGLYRAFSVNMEKNASWIPVDFCVNALICTVWHGTQNKLTNDNQITVYNYACNDYQKPMIAYARCLKNVPQIKLERSIWTPIIIYTKIRWLQPILNFVFNIIPALIIDMILTLAGEKFRLMRLIREKIDPQFSVVSYFADNEWTFLENNIHNMLGCLNEKEQEMYPFDMSKLDQKEWIVNMLLGVKVYLGKEKMDTNEKALRKHKILTVVHYIFLVMFWSGVLYLLYNISNYIIL